MTFYSLGLNLGLNFAVHGDTSFYGSNQLSFLSIKSHTSLCVVVFYCEVDLVTARNLEVVKMPDTAMCPAFAIY